MRAALAAVLGAAVVLVGAPPSAGQPVPPSAGRPVPPSWAGQPVSPSAGQEVQPDPPPGFGLSAAVAALPLTSPELTRAESALASMRSRQSNASERLGELGPELTTLRREVVALEGVVERRRAQVDKADAALARARTAVRQIAVEWYVTGFGALEGLDPALTADERERLAHQYVLSQSAAGAALDNQRRLEARRAELGAQLEDVEEQRSRRRARVDALESERAALETTVEEAERRLPQLEADLVVAQMGARVVGSDLSATALDAYWRAELALAALDPDCGVTWSVLAGIGRIESRHGTYQGNELGTDGRVGPGIFGPHLDGSGPFAIVPDSDRGALDGTAATDRAVGPMQFIPSTWRRFGADGTGDGEADPQNLYDAAVSAGAYLCWSGPGLGSEDRLRAAVLTYNRSLAYVEQVLAGARRYQGEVTLSR